LKPFITSLNFIDCSAPTAGQLVTTPCAPGNSTTLGMDTMFGSMSFLDCSFIYLFVDCSNPTTIQYVEVVCNSGNITANGTDTTIASMVLDQFFVD
jgi:hypothetical protein